jgi:hypothetical protein
MTGLAPADRNQRRRARRRGETVRWTIRVLVVLLVFVVGIALGQAIQDNPKAGRTVTFDRTFRIPTGGQEGSTITP